MIKGRDFDSGQEFQPLDCIVVDHEFNMIWIIKYSSYMIDKTVIVPSRTVIFQSSIIVYHGHHNVDMR